jgi:hypothetical protein
MQEDKNYSPRRLYDLKIGVQEREGSAIKYRLTSLGDKLQMLLSTDQALGIDLIHYLHYTSYSGAPEDRKLLWSYRRCCDYIWAEGKAIPSKTLASRIQSDISQEFPHISTTEKQGARFPASGVNQGVVWLRAMEPSPLDEDDKVCPRVVSNFQLAVLALDDLYRHKPFAYGSAVVLTDEVLDAVARVFFLDPANCRELLGTAAAFSSAVKLSDTLAGTSIALTRPYTLHDL